MTNDTDSTDLTAIQLVALETMRKNPTEPYEMPCMSARRLIELGKIKKTGEGKCGRGRANYILA